MLLNSMLIPAFGKGSILPALGLAPSASYALLRFAKLQQGLCEASSQVARRSKRKEANNELKGSSQMQVYAMASAEQSKLILFKFII